MNDSIEVFRDLAAQLDPTNPVRRASEALLRTRAVPEYVATGIRWMTEEIGHSAAVAAGR